VRQSTAAQVAGHAESTRAQYGLADRAVTLGWARSRVLVIDEDLGHSAAGIDARPGFARLVSEVGLDHIGIVLGIDMSRPARSGREWHQLLELCALSGALLGDLDGVYDPAEHNDRLLLGLKGTISEAELHLIKQRMWSGRMAKARRGELAVPLPIGFVRRACGEVILDPDEQVQAVVGLVFEAFERLGTIGAVLAFLVDAGIELGVRQREGLERGELSWRRPSRNTLANLLRNRSLRRHLRLRPQHGGPQTAAGGPTMHRTGAPGPGQLEGVPAGGRAVLYQRRAVRAEPGADGRQSGPGRKPGGGARRPGPAGRAGGLRPLRGEDDRALPARAGRPPAAGLRV
jgi:DNA invertase Pin-like site-specific DNA recombinase